MTTTHRRGTASQKPKPRELDLNITMMREVATRAIIDGLRAGFKRLDDIDALERMLNEQTPDFASRAAADVHATNGRNGHARHEEEDEPPAKRAYNRKNPTFRLDLKSIAIDAVAVIQNEKAGMTSSAIESELRARGVIPTKLSKAQGMATVNRALKRSRDQKLIRAEIPSPNERSQGKQAMYFAIGTAPAAAPTKTSTPAAAAAAAPTAGTGKTGKIDTKLPMRDAVVKALLTLPAGARATPQQIADILLADGWPKKRGQSALNMHVNWAVRPMAEKGVLDRKGEGPGKTTYSLRRPNVHITKQN